MSNKDKFKIGDRVRVVYATSHCFGMFGIVDGYESYDFTRVILEDGTITYWNFEDSLELVTPNINFDRDKHKEVMLAWINGSEIERYDDSCNTWWLDAEPKFETDVEYRVKRKVKVFKYKFAKMDLTFSKEPMLVVEINYNIIEETNQFICWLGNEITVECPED